MFAKSSEEALDLAAGVMSAYRRSAVQGSFQQFYDDAVDDRTWRNTDYTYNYSQKQAGLLRSSLEIKDRYPVNIYLRQFVYLVGPISKPTPRREDPIDPALLPRPDWADTIGALVNGRIFAVGDFTLRANPSDAWINAEELAIFQLLRTKQVTIGQVTRIDTKNGKDKYGSMQWIKLNFLMSNVRVDGRWVDPKSGDALVLVSSPVDAIRLLE